VLGDNPHDVEGLVVTVPPDAVVAFNGGAQAFVVAFNDCDSAFWVGLLATLFMLRLVFASHWWSILTQVVRSQGNSNTRWVLHGRLARRCGLSSFGPQVDLSCGEVVHAAFQSDGAGVEHFTQNRASIADLLHHQAHVCFSSPLNEIFILGGARLDIVRNLGRSGLNLIQKLGEFAEFDIVDRAFDGATIGMAEDEDKF